LPRSLKSSDFRSPPERKTVQGCQPFSFDYLMTHGVEEPGFEVPPAEAERRLIFCLACDDGTFTINAAGERCPYCKRHNCGGNRNARFLWLHCRAENFDTWKGDNESISG